MEVAMVAETGVGPAMGTGAAMVEMTVAYST